MGSPIDNTTYCLLEQLAFFCVGVLIGYYIGRKHES
jgi:uncharacterized protein YneF (UPF0154 family)